MERFKLKSVFYALTVNFQKTIVGWELMKTVIMIGSGILVTVILLIVIDVLTISTTGCTLPIDLVLGDTCLFGSLGATLAIGIVLTIVFGIVSLVFSNIKKIFR